MTPSRIKNLTSKNLPKILEAFTIAINLTASNAWLERILLRPCEPLSNFAFLNTSQFERIALLQKSQEYLKISWLPIEKTSAT